MGENIIEYYRKKCIERLFKTDGFKKAWTTWKNEINNLSKKKTQKQIFDLGDHLRDIFYSTSTGKRGQSEVSGGGANWESLVCWYLNLCLIGRRTIVIKHNKELIPEPISNAITVNYGSFTSNTESDLIAITFPDENDYNIDKYNIKVFDQNQEEVRITKKGKKQEYNLLGILNALCSRDFSKLEIHIIQCKTNWNDNAQIPMLWDMLYSANTFRKDIKIGKEGYSIHNAKRFTYSFVTVPTVKLEKINSDSTCVQRVRNLSGGNFWGLPSKSNVASSIKELLDKNLKNGHPKSHLETLHNELKNLSTLYNYFNL